MAAITSNVPAFTNKQFVAGHSECAVRGTNKLVLISPGLYTLVPSVCSLLDYVHRGNFFTVTINEDLVYHTSHPDDFILNTHIVAAWDWMLNKARNYLANVVQPISPYSSNSFLNATCEIGIDPERWLPYIIIGMVAITSLCSLTPLPLMMSSVTCAAPRITSAAPMLSPLPGRCP